MTQREIQYNINQIIAVCKKPVKTQINTKSVHWGMKFATAISQELLTQSSWSLLQRTRLPLLQGLVISFPPISSHYLFQKTQPQNTCPLHSADNYSRTSVSILSKLSQFVLLTYRQGLIHVHTYFLTCKYICLSCSLNIFAQTCTGDLSPIGVCIYMWSFVTRSISIWVGPERKIGRDIDWCIVAAKPLADLL